MLSKTHIAVFLVLLVVTVAVTDAAVIRVPDDQPTIQAGINAAIAGDTVLVESGTYIIGDSISFFGKAITLRSESGPESTIIKGTPGYHTPGLIFNQDEGNDTVVDGFTIQDFVNFDTTNEGGAVRIGTGCAPIIRNCVIRLNEAQFGGGAWVTGGHPADIPTFESCFFDRNLAGRRGGALHAGDEVRVVDCIFAANDAGDPSHILGFGGAIYLGNTWTRQTILDSVFYNNYSAHGGALYIDGDDVIIRNCLFVNNETYLTGGGCNECHGGAIFLDNADVDIWYSTFDSNAAANSGNSVYNDQSNLLVVATILWDLGPVTGSTGSTSAIWYSNVRGGWTGTGSVNINLNPLFVDGPDGDHYLSQVAAGQAANSPCLDNGEAQATARCGYGVDGTLCLSDFTTRTDQVQDSAKADQGFHFPQLGSAVFSDGFESGDFSGWSVVVP